MEWLHFQPVLNRLIPRHGSEVLEIGDGDDLDGSGLRRVLAAYPPVGIEAKPDG